MVAHEIGSEDQMNRNLLRQAPRNETRDGEHDKTKLLVRERFISQDDNDDGSDTEDDAPLAAGLRHFMKTEKARSPPPSTLSPSNRLDSKVFKGGDAAVPSVSMPLQGMSTTPKESGKRSKPEAPKFLLLLFEILQTENPKVIRWSEDGLSLQILDPAIVTDKILPKYFNHTNFHSFQRQLNYFGFRKWTKSKTDICTFSHPYFRQNQPELLQLIKRKKAPRRTPVAEKVEGYCNQLDSAGSTKLLPLSPSGKRKLPTSDGHHENAAASHQQMNAPNVPIQPAINGIPIAPMHGHQQHGHLSGMHHDQAATQYLSASALLNNVISPLAASECNKKAKKIDKKAYLPTSDYRAPLQSPTDPTATSMCDLASMHNVDRLSSVNGFSSNTLPTLDIVRNRIIRRQQVHAHGSDSFGGYHGYSSPHSGHGVGATTTAHMMGEHRPDLMNLTRPMTPVGVGDHSPAFTNSFSDPVDILLRIKKSRTSSSEGQSHPHNDSMSPEKQAGEQSDNLASLHNFLIGHTLYTNRLESQLKMVVEENDALKHLVDAKHREVESLQGERKMLQHENAVLIEDKNKLFEINRELLGKLFPQ